MLQERPSDALRAHPATVPWGALVECLDLALPPSAVAVMAGIGYTAPHDLPLTRAYERAFGFLSALGFHSESFCSDDPHVALEALERQWDLMARRWKVLPVFSVYPVPVPGEAAHTLVPVELGELDGSSVLVRSVAGSTRVPLTDYLAAPRAVHGHAAPLPSMRAILAPHRVDVARIRRDAVARELRRMREASDGIVLLESFLGNEPTETDVEHYRTRVRRALLGPAGNVTGYRDLLADELAEAGHGRAAILFSRSADLHGQFLAGDDDALAEIVRTERAAFAEVGR